MRAPLALLVALAACGKGTLDVDDTASSGPTDTEDTDDTHVTDTDPAEVTLAGVPAEVVPGAPWPTVTVSGVDGEVTLDVSGDGASLEGALTATASGGVATFDGLVARGCGALEIAVGDAAADVDVAPIVEVDAGWPIAAPPGPLSLALRLVDADGAVVAVDGEVHATATGDVPLADDPTVAALVGGPADVALVADGTGALTVALAVDAGACALSAEAGPALIGEIVSEPVFLPSTRVGDAYAAVIGGLPADPLVGPVPAWLDVDPSTGLVAGVPDAAGPVTVELAGWDGATVARRVVRFGVFDADDALGEPASTPSERGPYDDDATELVIEEITTSRGTFSNVAVRVAYPSEGGGVTPGPHPLVAFHHAAHSPADIYDHYTALHGHLASHGVIVASVDSEVNVSGQSQSWDNLSDMSAFQRAAIDRMLEAAADPASPFFGAVDPDRLLVSGHSRGGGASLISLWEDPRLLGAICFEQVSPIQTPGQDFDDPARNGDRPYPARPILFLAAADDRDEPWPLVDTSYPQTTGPTAFVTLMGANHEDTYDADTPGSKTSISAIPIEDRHDLDQHYATAFLRRFAMDALDDEGWLFGLPGASSDLSELGVVMHGRRYMGSALVVDDFQDDLPGEDLLGGAVTGGGLTLDEDGHPFEEGLYVTGRDDERSVRIGVWAQARHIAWSSGDPELAFAMTPEGAGIDVGDARRLRFRVHRECAPISGWSGDPGCPDGALALTAILRDGAGAEAEVPVADGLGALGVVGRYEAGAILDLAWFSGVDLTDVAEVRLRFDATSPEDGELWLDDVRFE